MSVVRVGVSLARRVGLVRARGGRVAPVPGLRCRHLELSPRDRDAETAFAVCRPPATTAQHRGGILETAGDGETMPDESPKRPDPVLPTLDHLPRPVTDAPHDRHFADGEEPPERYDRTDEIEYVLPQEYTLDSRKYFRVARKHYRHCCKEFALSALINYSRAFAGGTFGE